jgi:tRNA threonylcarbamoyladenosine biosynthesis protein TsaE
MTFRPVVVECAAAADTEAFAARLAADLAPGALLLLHGDLGAGKTVFVRGLAAGLGADPDEVSSPTFTLVQEYRGRLLLRHLDLYRLDHQADIDELDVDTLRDDAVVAVEWAQRMRDVPPGAWRIEIAVGPDEVRRIRVEGPTD